MVGNASAVVAATAAGFKRCYNAGLREENSNMNGSVRLTAKIDAAGFVAPWRMGRSAPRSPEGRPSPLHLRNEMRDDDPPRSHGDG
jgi:hypothetical protein